MAVFPQQQFTLDNVPMRAGPHGERAIYDSKSLGRKFIGSPKGVYMGFEPSAVGGLLSLTPDGSRGASVLKVPSADDPAGMDIIVEGVVTLDFATTPPGDFLPDGIQVVAIARYFEDSATEAEIITRPKTTSSVVGTIGPSPATFDLSVLPQERIIASSISIPVIVDGFGPDSITDDGAGNLASTGPALPGGGTVNYYTGEIVGVTANLVALSSVSYSRTRGVRRDEVQVCRVTGVPAAIVVVGTGPVWGAPLDRDLPLAAGAADLDYGFMPPTAMEALADAVEILNEVAAARIDLQGTTHPELKDRLDTDLGAEAMGIRLGKTVKLIRSNTHSAAAGVTSVNVSGSMSSVNRIYEPKVSFPGGGSETQIGVVTGPVDTVRNVALLVDGETGERLIDNEIDRNIVIGRLEQATDLVLDGVLTFTNALTVVTGDDNAQFTVQVEAGDTIQGTDGLFYEVSSIPADDQLFLKDAFQGATASSANLLRRRFTLNLFRLIAGTELAYALAEAAEIEVFFPVFLSMGPANFHNALMYHRSGERGPIPDATPSAPGKVELAGAVSPFAGAVKLQQRGVNVGAPGEVFHTLNFNAAESQLSELASGIVEVVEIGGTGPQGIGGGPGPAGPAGADGQSLTSLTTMALDNEEFVGPGGPSPVVITHTVDFGYNITFLSGGFARYRDLGLFSNFDWFEIDSIRADSATVGTIEGFGAGESVATDFYVTLFLSACGYTT